MSALRKFYAREMSTRSKRKKTTKGVVKPLFLHPSLSIYSFLDPVHLQESSHVAAYSICQHKRVFPIYRPHRHAVFDVSALASRMEQNQ